MTRKTEHTAQIKYKSDTSQAEAALARLKKKTTDLQKAAAANAKQGAAILAGVAASAGTAVRAYAKQEQAERKVAASIRAVGQSSGLTLEKVKGMASELQRLTVHGDETALAMAGMGIRVANLSEKTMPRFLMASADLATTFDKDINMMSQTLARALADPERGLTQLQRYGVVFSDEQKKLVAEAGTMAEKHAIIMGALEERYGGAAEAAAQGTGKMTQLANKIGDVWEEVGKKVFAAIEPIVDGLNKLADAAVKPDSMAVKLATGAIKFATALGVLKLAVAGVTAAKWLWAKAGHAAGVGATAASRGVWLLSRAMRGLPMMALVVAVGELIWHLPRLVQHFDKVRLAVTDVWDALSYRTQAGLASIKVKYLEFMQGLEQSILAFQTKANEYLPDAMKFDIADNAAAVAAYQVEINKLTDKIEDLGKKAETASSKALKSSATAWDAVTKDPLGEDIDAAGGEVVGGGGAKGIHGVSAREKRDQWELEQIRRQNEAKKQEALDAREALEEEMAVKELDYRAQREENELLGMSEFDLRKQELEHELWLAEKARKLGEAQGLSDERLAILDKELKNARLALSKHAKAEEQVEKGSLSSHLQMLTDKFGMDRLFGEKGKAFKKALMTGELKMAVARDAAEAFTKGLANPPGPPFSLGQAALAAATVVAKGAAGFAGIQSAQMGGRVPGGHSSRDNRMILAQSGEHIVPVGEPWEQVRRGIIREAEASGEMSSNNDGAGGTREQVVRLEFTGELGEVVRRVQSEDRDVRGD